MKTLKTILIDDEPAGLEALSREIRAYCPEVGIIAQCSSPSVGLEAIKKHQPDLVFLDVEMPQINGFDLLKSLPEIDFEVIFVTAYDEFALRAFEFDAVDYLLKPVLKDKLIRAVERAAERRRQSFFSSEKLEALLNHMSLFQNRNPNIAVPTAEGLEFIPASEISHLEADGSYTRIHLTSGRMLIVSRNLKDMEALLVHHPFLRVHQSYLVNIPQIRKYLKGRGGYLIMENGANVPVARSRREEVLKVIY